MQWRWTQDEYRQFPAGRGMPMGPQPTQQQQQQRLNANANAYVASVRAVLRGTVSPVQLVQRSTACSACACERVCVCAYACV